MTSYPFLRLLVSVCALAAAIDIGRFSPASAETAPNFESRRTAAYQKFHHGEARDAAKEIRALANEATDDVTKARLLRDLTEICATAADVDCTMQAQAEAFQLAQKTGSQDGGQGVGGIHPGVPASSLSDLAARSDPTGSGP